MASLSRPVLLRCLYRFLRWGLAAIFVWAGTAKLLDPDTFAVIIREYHLLPLSLVRPTAFALPILEVVSGLALALDLRGSLAAVTAQMLLFIGVLLYGISQGIDVDCGCFGMYDPETSLYGKLKPALYRDLLLLAGIAVLYWARHQGVAVRRGWLYRAPSADVPAAADRPR